MPHRSMLSAMIPMLAAAAQWPASTGPNISHDEISAIQSVANAATRRAIRASSKLARGKPSEPRGKRNVERRLIRGVRVADGIAVCRGKLRVWFSSIGSNARRDVNLSKLRS